MKDTMLTRTFPVDRLQTAVTATPHRTTHGGCAWSLPSRYESTLRQPQDGAIPNGTLHSIDSIDPVDATDARPHSNRPVEAEDARLNGTLRSLARRVKGLNIMQYRPADPVLQTSLYFSEPAIASLTPLPSLRPEPTRKAPNNARPRTAQTQVA